MLDLIIKNGTLYDGTGDDPKTADIGIKKDEIAAVGDLKSKSAKLTIDAKGLCVAPGFIDMQNHSDSFWSLFDYPHQESMVLQGVTTIVVGQCGASLAPLASLEALKSVQKWHTLEGANLNWRYFEEYAETLRKTRLGVNVASLIGHSTLRRGLLKDEVRRVSGPELEALKRMAVSAFKNGSFGLSMGLAYSHEYDSTYDELLSFANLVKKRDLLLSVHLRNESAGILEALEEAIKLASESGARLKISHLKIRGRENWHLVDQVLRRLENAYQRGTSVSFDVYPYTTSWSVLYTYLPKWSSEGGRAALVKRLSQPYVRNKVLSGLFEQKTDFSKIMIATATSSPHLVGRSLVEIARDQNTSAEEAVLNILSSNDSEVVVFDENISEENLNALLKHPLAMIATDGAGFDVEAAKMQKNLVHPRCFGAMPRFISKTLAENLMPLQTAIFKISGYPAKILGIARRGIVKKHAFADLVLFDREKIGDAATLENPFRAPDGIEWVIINGKTAVFDGRISGNFSGRVLTS